MTNLKPRSVYLQSMIQLGHGHQVTPVIWFKYDMSPITVKYIEKAKPIYSFLTTVSLVIFLFIAIIAMLSTLSQHQKLGLRHRWRNVHRCWDCWLHVIHRIWNLQEGSDGKTQLGHQQELSRKWYFESNHSIQLASFQCLFC